MAKQTSRTSSKGGSKNNTPRNIFNRWIADMRYLGIAIPWDEFL